MNNLYKNSLLFAALAFPLSVSGQHMDYIWKPEFSYSWKKSDRLGFNSKISLFNSIPELNTKSGMEYAEATVSFSYGLSVGTKIGGGYLYRLASPFAEGYQYEHRLIQQSGFISYIGDTRLAHRLRAEQRIRSEGYVNRLRYRLSYDFPLQGDRLDAGERYLIISDEILTSFNLESFKGENRIYAGMGWYFSSKKKLELGAQYRILDIFTGEGLNHLVLFSTSFYLNR